MQWLKSFINFLSFRAQAPELMESPALEYWKNTTLKKYVSKYRPEQEEVNHVLDFLKSSPEIKLEKLSYPQAVIKAKAWTKSLNKKNKGLKTSGTITEILTFANGLKWVHLLDQESKDWEGLHMGHCVASYRNHKGIYSLRDHKNFPHLTVEVSGRKIRQVKGKFNSKFKKKYSHEFESFLQKKKFKIPYRTIVIKELGLVGFSFLNAQVLKKNFVGIKKMKYGVQKFYDISTLKPKINHLFETKVLGKEWSFRERIRFITLLYNCPHPAALIFAYESQTLDEKLAFLEYDSDYENILNAYFLDASIRKDTTKLDKFLKLFENSEYHDRTYIRRDFFLGWVRKVAEKYEDQFMLDYFNNLKLPPHP